MAGGNAKKGKANAEAVDTPENQDVTNSQFAIIIDKMTDLCQQMGVLSDWKKTVDQLAESVKFMNAKYEEQKTALENIQGENKARGEELAVVMNSIYDLQKENVELKNKIHELEQYSRSKNIELVGVPETPGENLDTVMSKIGEKLGMSISSNQIDAIHRVPTKSSTQPKPIVVRFHSRRTKEAIINKARKTKIQAVDLCVDLPDTPIYVNEHLTQENKRLIHLAGLKRRELKYKFLWTRGGHIFIKKTEESPPIKITCDQDIAKIV